MPGYAFVVGAGQPQVLRQYPTVVLLCMKAVLNDLRASERASMRAFVVSFLW